MTIAPHPMPGDAPTRPPGQVVPFPAGRRSRRGPAEAGSAEILLFLGVRYERLDAREPAADAPAELAAEPRRRTS
ncbi:hypothetical protein [Methylobacterium sp. A54F]